MKNNRIPRTPLKTPHTMSWPPPRPPVPDGDIPPAIKGNYPDGIGKGTIIAFLILSGLGLTVFTFYAIAPILL